MSLSEQLERLERAERRSLLQRLVGCLSEQNLSKGGNMDIKVDGDKLTITATISSGVPSSTGKSLVVATTNGFVGVDGSDIKVSLNVIKPRKS